MQIHEKKTYKAKKNPIINCTNYKILKKEAKKANTHTHTTIKQLPAGKGGAFIIAIPGNGLQT